MSSIKRNYFSFLGSPFEFHVDELKSGQATAFGPGLTHGICGETATFTVNTKDAGPGMYIILIIRLVMRTYPPCLVFKVQ